MAANNAESADSQTHIFGVKCKNGHITYYDKDAGLAFAGRQIVTG